MKKTPKIDWILASILLFAIAVFINGLNEAKDYHINANLKLFFNNNEVEYNLDVYGKGSTINDFLSIMNATLMGNYVIAVKTEGKEQIFSAYTNYVIKDGDIILITDSDDYDEILNRFNKVMC